jgi:hypothetical protein
MLVLRESAVMSLWVVAISFLRRSSYLRFAGRKNESNVLSCNTFEGTSTGNSLDCQWHIPEFSTEQGETGLFVLRMCGASRSFIESGVTASDIQKNLGDDQVELRGHEDDGHHCWPFIETDRQ